MAIIKCKMCGGDIELSADKTFGTCEYCGSTMTLPKVDSEQRAAAFNRGNHFRRMGEFDKALAVYERIVQENDADAEAHWCCALCRYGIEYVEDPNTYEWLPTCHRASFDSFLEDVDYLAALENSDGITRRQYQKDAAKIAEVQRGILAASRNTEPYDVFISYKELDKNGERTRDSILAQDIYYQLTEKGWRVFFSRISLEDVPGTEYEPYIFAALNSAKVMVAVGTSGENLNSVWVKNEWSRFLSLMRKDRSKLLLPCYRDMDPYDLPEQLSVLMSYDMGKIGFIQDLIRGIDKVLSADKPKEVVHEPVKETVVVQQGGGPNVTALLKRGEMALQDGNWQDAMGYFDRVLDMDAECADAYLGLFLVEEQCADTDAFVQKRLEGLKTCETETLFACTEDISRINAVIAGKLIPNYLAKMDLQPLFNFDRSYKSSIKGRQKQLEAEKQYLATSKNLSRAEKFAMGDTKNRVSQMKNTILSHAQKLLDEAELADEAKTANVKAAYAKRLDEAELKANKLYEDALARREANYNKACQLAETAKTEQEYLAAASMFYYVEEYKDSREKRALCMAEAKKIKAEQERIAAEKKAEEERIAAEEAERKRIAEEKAKQERKRIAKKIATITAVITSLAVASYFTVTLFVIPFMKYKEAEELFDAGKYIVASAAFAEISDFKDSSVRSNEAIYAEAERLYSAGEYGEAAVAFAKVGSYSDAAERSMELWSELGSVGNWESISAGNEHTVGIKSDGTVVAVGDTRHGQCDVGDWTGIVAVSAGYNLTVGLKEDGTVVAVGSNKKGQCDVSSWQDIVAISAGGLHTVGLKSDGTVVAVGCNNNKQCDVNNWRDIVAISAGSNYTVGLKSDGTVVAVGDNFIGQCDVSGWQDIVAISAGQNHTVGLKSDGTVVAVGYNSNKQCYVSTWQDIVAVSADGLRTVGLKSDCTAVAVGYDRYGQYDVRVWQDIAAISAGSSHTVGLKSDGTVVAIGSNACGQCNVSDWQDIMVYQR